MKRRALGKGLDSLIPTRGGIDPLAGALSPKPESSIPPMSAADIERASKQARRPIPRPSPSPHGAGEETDEPGTEPSEAGTRSTSQAVDPGNRVPERSDETAGDRSLAALQWIDIDRIKPNPLQPRKHFPSEQIAELTASIRATGILQPIILRRIDGGYGLVAGERRWRAAQQAGLLKVPAIIREINDERLLEVALIENLQREDLNPIEEARAFASLIEDFGFSPSEVAERVGKDRSTLANALRLLKLAPKVQEQLQSGAMTTGHARALVSLPTHRAQELGAQIVIDRGLSVRETESWVKRHTDEPKPKAVEVRDPNYLDAEQKLQKLLGTRVRIVPGIGEKGKIVLEYYSVAELDRLYQRLAKA